jgi:hypothetical protein
MEDEIKSIHHHYTPVFYLKGFADEKGEFYVLNKDTGSIKYKGPKGAFVEEHRNTGILTHPETGETFRSDMAETILARFDSGMGKALNAIRKCEKGANIMADKFLLGNIKLLANSLFWRSPANEALLTELIDKTPFKDLGFGIFDNNV